MTNTSYEIDPHPADLGGGWRLRLLENGEEVGGGVFPANHSDPDPTAPYDEALAAASAWLSSREVARATPHMLTKSGIDYVPGALRVRDVRISDTAHALALICRFGGHCTEHYSVAQHSLLVANILASIQSSPEAVLCGLLHDAHEAYVGDVPTPIKAQLGGAWTDLEHQAEETVLDAFGLRDAMNDWHDIVKHADLVALATERRDLLLFDSTINLPWAILDGVVPHQGLAAPVSATPQRWSAVFLERFVMLRDVCDARSSIFTT